MHPYSPRSGRHLLCLSILLFTNSGLVAAGDQGVARQSDDAAVDQQELDAERKLAEARTQVEQGIKLASNARAGVSEYYIFNGEWPDSAASVPGPGPMSGPNVESIAVVNGTIVIRFSASASVGVAGKQLTLRPTILPHKTVYWTCGYAQSQGAEPATGAAARLSTNIDPTYLPTRCQ